MPVPSCPFNEEFCLQLELRLSQSMAASGRADLKGFWCDGISWQPSDGRQLHPKQVNDTRRIVTQAWLGRTGQDNYELTVHLGRRALSRYAKGVSMVDCIPAAEEQDWWEVDVERQRMEIWLE